MCDRIMKIVRGAPNAGELISESFGKMGFPFVLSNFVASNVLENIVVENFARSNPASAKTKDSKRPCIGLGYLAENLTMLLTGLDDDRVCLGLDLIYALPHLNAYGQISEMYTQMNKMARKISTTDGGK